MERRRHVLAGLAALGLSACGGAGLGQGTRPTARPGTGGARVNEFVESPNPGWDAWVASFKPRAVASGIPEAVVEQAFQGPSTSLGHEMLHGLSPEVQQQFSGRVVPLPSSHLHHRAASPRRARTEPLPQNVGQPSRLPILACACPPPSPSL